MKSLEILQEGLEFMIKAIKVNPNSVKELQSEIDIYNEAILELQVIQDIIEEKDEIIEADRIIFKSKLQELENRSCSNCNNFKIFNSKVVRDSCSILNVSDIGGCGDFYEPKKG